MALIWSAHDRGATEPKHPNGAASLYLEPGPPHPDVDQSRLGRRERIDVDGPRASQETAEPIRQHGRQPRAQRIAELRYARLEDDRLRRQALLVLADHKQHPWRARGGRRDHPSIPWHEVDRASVSATTLVPCVAM